MPDAQALQLDRLLALPKAEVHAHLEGCFEADVLKQWAAKARVRLPRPREHLFEFAGLADFLHFLDWACGLASTRERLAELSYGYSKRLADGGAGYADLIVNPTHWTAWHDRLPDMIDAIHAGFTAAEQDGLPPVGLCVSLLRTQSADAAAELVDRLVALRHPRVVALSIDGNEAAAGRTGPRFAEAFRRAGAAGLRRTVHAGESSGPEGVLDAIEWLGADRIDHGAPFDRGELRQRGRQGKADPGVGELVKRPAVTHRAGADSWHHRRGDRRHDDAFRRPERLRQRAAARPACRSGPGPARRGAP